MRVRDEVVAELRAQGDAHLARLVAGTKKPDRAHWAVGRVDSELRQSLELARGVAQQAQAHESGDALRGALAEYHRAVNAVVAAAKKIMTDAGMTASRANERAMHALLEGHAEDPLEALRKK
jgi:hypothetical protein